MSTLLVDERSSAKNVPSYHCSRVLKSKENIFKPKHNKSMKNKLKKYKLRKDGREDPDIIDVSKTLISSLRIKSPNNQNGCRKVSQENNPHNYLTKMVRLKKSAAVVESVPTNAQRSNEIKNESISPIPACDQDKKQTDAFELLMASRNKSIGTNSPGKEKCKEESEGQEKLEKKELKAKRILSLNIMAQAKGSLKKMELEEYRQEIIKRKMECRAKNLKNIIVGVDLKNRKKGPSKHTIDKLVEKPVSPIIQDLEVDKTKAMLNNKNPILKTFDLFEDLNESPPDNIKKISKEDEEFLKKLSPSIKKKENMLCYFQKVSRDSEKLQSDSDNETMNNDKVIIKVKLKSKTQLKKRKYKHTQIQTNGSAIKDRNMEHETQSTSHVPSNNSQKTKCNINIELGEEENLKNNNHHHDVRPRRNTKRPVKYSDDFLLTSSDEELHIFTPKKKRKGKSESQVIFKGNSLDEIKKDYLKLSLITENDVKANPIKIRKVKKIPKSNNEDSLAESPKAKSKQITVPKRAAKLAPIFVTKPQLDPAVLKAKQQFLQSGVPSQLKKYSVQSTSTLATDEFQTVVHIQNLSNTTCITRIINSNLNNNYDNDHYAENTSLLLAKDNLFKNLLYFPVMQNRSMPPFQKNVDLILQDIKKSYPKFPVYRTYHLLRGKSKGEFKDCVYPDLDNSVEIFNDINNIDINNVHPDKLNWTDKYKPTMEKQVIGNFQSIKELKRWLVTWTENKAKSKQNKGDRSDSSDFYHSDTDSRDTMKIENNLLIITGNVGSGKTLSVYTVAAELAIKVIEVNASTKRTGKIMLQDLQEATQSHKVDRGKSSTECSQKSQETKTYSKVLKVIKKRGRKKKVKHDCDPKSVDSKKESKELTVSQENVRTGMSLILIDDADIVFDQDDGFCYAISQLVQSSKRPVILVTSSLTCPHLQKFLQMAKIIKLRPFLPRMLGTWIDIMCLVDNNICSTGLGAKILDLFKGDIRKTMNYLQFYMTSQKHIMCSENGSGISQGEEMLKVNVDDENSCMSWADSEGWGDKNTDLFNSNDIASNYFVNKELQLLQSSSHLNNYYIWWNLPNILNFSWKSSHDEAMKRPDKSNKCKQLNELNTIAGLLDTMSLTDYWEKSNLNEELNILSSPWHSYESDSVIDSENFASYNRSNECGNDISCELMTKTIAVAQKVFKSENKSEFSSPSLSIQRQRDKVVSRHKILTNSLNPSVALDRRALALDYWSSCRSICRTEKTKTDIKSKRNNRFCHYLKSLNVLCKNDYFDTLSESLSFHNNT